ncbi:response regulator [Pseudoduganella sp. HUAS MS19]|jgi:CheY-like chemotaxis protein
MEESHPRVLLVDDNRDAVDMVSQLLNHHAIETRVAYDGQSALALLTAWQADVVLVDIQMPGLNGYETAKAMHALPGCAELPIIAWTAWDSSHNNAALVAARIVHCLAKPFEVQQLLDLVHRFGATRPSGPGIS